MRRLLTCRETKRAPTVKSLRGSRRVASSEAGALGGKREPKEKLAAHAAAMMLTSIDGIVAAVLEPEELRSISVLRSNRQTPHFERERWQL
jgi:hypothetical protein